MHAVGDMPKLRIFSNSISSFFISLAARKKIKDTQIGYRLYPVSLLKKIDFTHARYEFETEILIKASRLGFSFKQVNVKSIYHPPEETKTYYRNFSDSWRVFKVVLKAEE